MKIFIFLLISFWSFQTFAHYLEPLEMKSPQGFYEKFNIKGSDVPELLSPDPEGKTLNKFVFTRDGSIGKLFCKKDVRVFFTKDRTGDSGEEVFIFQGDNKKIFCIYGKFIFSGDAMFSLKMEPIEIRFGKELDKESVKDKIFLSFKSIYFRKEFLKDILDDLNIKDKEFYGEGVRFSSAGVIIFEPFEVYGTKFPAYTELGFYARDSDGKYYPHVVDLPDGASVKIGGIPCKKDIEVMFKKVSYCTLSEDYSFGADLTIKADTIVDLSFDDEKNKFRVHKFGPMGSSGRILKTNFKKGECGEMAEDEKTKIIYARKTKCPIR